MTAVLRPLSLGLCLLSISTTLIAAGVNPELCPSGFINNESTFIPTTTNDQRVFISADSASVDSDAVTVFEGTVRAQQANRLLEADYVRYDRNTEAITAKGNIVYSVVTPTINTKLSGDTIEYNVITSKGTVHNTEYFTGSVNGRGRAQTIHIKSDKEFEMDSATYTTCPPDDQSWELYGSNISIDNESRQGSATNVVVSVASVPVFYFPYLRFPIGEQRLSGLLYPGITVSNRHGTEISIPYYWNIAPNLDTTITLRNMTRRGLMLENEFRYLTDQSTGVIEINYLPNDKVFDDDRKQYIWSHTGAPSAGWSTSVDYKFVGDTQYIDDFSDTLASSSVTHLKREGVLAYNHQNFEFNALLQNYQNITGVQPYERVPQLTLNSRFTNEANKLNYDVKSEYVRFAHEDETQLIGERLVINPFISYPIESDPGFFIPQLSVHHLQYNLDQLVQPTDEATPSATVPVFSTDMGVFFERDMDFAGTKLLHTLEPQLFYLYAPKVDQSSLPVFDTALTTFSSSLFYSQNRFSGNDRIGDANQLTASVATRFFRQDTGNEVFNAMVGQIIYFRDREIILPGGVVDTTDRSSYIASLSFNPTSRINLSSEFIVDSELEHTSVTNSRLSYKVASDTIINYDYRFRRNELRTQGLSFAWRINPRWQVFGGHESDLENDHRLENFFGLRYDDCCWGLRIVGHEYFDKLVGTNPRYESAVWLELELKGLSSLGSRKKIDTLLEDGILGYSR